MVDIQSNSDDDDGVMVVGMPCGRQWCTGRPDDRICYETNFWQYDVDLVTTPLDNATYDYECMDPRVYSAKFSAFKKLVENFDLLDAINKVNWK